MKYYKEPVYIIDGLRTPFLKAKAERGPLTASDLGVYVSRSLFLKLPILASQVDEVITGCVMPSENEANIARIIALRVGCGDFVPAYTVARNCASGMQAIASAAEKIALGHSECILAVGTEAMSHAPLMFPPSFINWVGRLRSCKSRVQKLKRVLEFRPSFLNPTIALLQGLTDPLLKMGMGQTAQEIAHYFEINREKMDDFSLRSHQKASSAWKDGVFSQEVVPLILQDGQIFNEDDGIRHDLTLAKLAALKPVFEKYADITPGNSSQITDGAGAMILASESFVKRNKIDPIAEILDQSWSGCSGAMMGLGPVRSMNTILMRQNLTFDDIDNIEINEAFAAQVLGCLKSFDQSEFGKRYCQIEPHVGSIKEEKLNCHGGAIALGHPVGASGVRIVLRTIKTLTQQQGSLGLASLCIGGGQGGAMLVRAL